MLLLSFIFLEGKKKLDGYDTNPDKSLTREWRRLEIEDEMKFLIWYFPEK